MVSPLVALTPRVQTAIAAALGDAHREADPVLRPSQFADVQVNAALALAKKVGLSPREVAAKIVDALDLDGVCDSVEVSGPGFINLTFSSSWIAGLLQDMEADERSGVALQTTQNIPIDYSAPNVAKEMHVGHLRTTVVGDSLARTLEHLGHHVIRQNHIGDWGTPFGMLIEHLLDVGRDSEEADLLVSDPNAFYQAARVKFDSDPVFAGRARERVVKLQSGTDPATMELWAELVELSKAYLRGIYARLGVTLTDDDIRGESFYNDMLPSVADDLVAKGLARISDGALCAFPEGFTSRDGTALPVIIRKSDGGYNYSTSDLATVRYRVDKVNCDRAVYVVGADQALHFRMVFAVAREAGWLPAADQFEHAQIGLVQGKDGHRLRTRAGDLVKLNDLLTEGVERARAKLDEIERDEGELALLDLDAIAEDVGIGAIKYADLSTARDSAYIFDWDRMISFKGNTGPYLQYATTRIRSIFRRAGGDESDLPGPILVSEPAERELARKLLEFGAVVTQVADTAEPHRLCAYLFEVASLFTTFYEQCPVLKADDETRQSRLALCAAVLRVLTTGLGLLGVPLPGRM
jgi:arginyl-tRNA synthetase